MIDVKFEIDGRRVDPHNVADALEAIMLKSIAQQIQEKVSSVRHPVTGEKPVVLVRGADLDNLSVEVTGSEELVSIVREQLGLNQGEIVQEQKQPLNAFLCHASEDKPLARRIAADLHAHGINTFFDEWEMRAGDSLRQKIDSGLGECSHFIALLSPVSLTKPWVNAEMDGAFVRKLEGSCRFIALRAGLAPEGLPPLLRGSLSPAIDNYDTDIKVLISDILGLSRKPPVGPLPSVVTEQRTGTGLSAAAETLARFIVEASKTGMTMDPQLSPDHIRQETGLNDDDIVDAVDELHSRGMLKRYASLGCGPIGFHMVAPETELFASLDKHFKPWNAEEDALLIAADMVNSGKDGVNTPELATRLGWEPRRMNPAVGFLTNRRLVDASRALGTHPWEHIWIRRTAETRRFVRDRS